MRRARVALAAVATLSLALLASASDKPTHQYQVPGLEKPARILVDQWGVPHIYAGTHYDAFFVQGFNAARDRLWQIDTWRRRGLGQLSEVFGSGFVAQDRAARLFLYRGDMYTEWLSYGSDAKRIAQAFTNGINAYIDLIASHPELLPPEFELLSYRPAKWSAKDVVRIRSNGLWRNVTSEVRRAQLLCEHGEDAIAQWRTLEPEWTAQIPAGLDPCAVPADVLDAYLLAKAPVSFGMNNGAVSTGFDLRRAEGVGSNNWAVAPSRTSTGRAILADDPHRAHAVPSLRYVAHLNAPGLNVIGAGEPALPGISIGHNDRIAFGLTIFPIDQEDLYFYPRIVEQGRLGYQYRGVFEPVQVIQETIAVKDAAPVIVDLQFTRHGPVVYADDKHLWVVRAAWLQPRMAPYFGSVEYMRASNWREFVAALNRWGAPSENQVYADIDGNIGYKPAGLFPVRRTWDGLLPVPGDGRYEWDGFFDMDVLPEEYNPARGFTGTANSMNLPADYDIDRFRIGFEWSQPWRYRRLWQVLEQQDNHSLEDSTQLQRDYRSLLAIEVLKRIPNIAEFGEAGKMLASWDHSLTPESSAGALWVVWYYKELVPALASPLGTSAIDSLQVLSRLEAGVEPQLLAATLNQAWRTAERLMGPDPRTWQWGQLHQIRFRHPLLDQADELLAKKMTFPAYPRGGTANTANSTGFGQGFEVERGASFRMVLDVGNWDAARMTNAPGQSGDPRSPFYANLLENWATEGDVPLLFSQSAVEANVSLRIELSPKSDAQK